MRRWYSIGLLSLFLCFGLGYYRAFYCQTAQGMSDLSSLKAFPAEFRKKVPTHQKRIIKPQFAPDRGYIKNERQQAVIVRIIDKADRTLDIYYIFPNERIRITRLFNTIKALVINGKIIDECIVQGVEFPMPLSRQTEDSILIKEDQYFFPYLECRNKENLE